MRRSILVFALILGSCVAVHAQPGGVAARPISPEVAEATRKIIAEIDKNSQLMLNLEYLCDVIGPRLTGSANLKRANEWTREKFTAYGLENAHLEPWKIARGWTRGTVSGRIVAPSEHRILLESAGWSPGTNGPARGKVVHIEATTVAELVAYKGKLKGAWIIGGPVSVQPNPKTTAETTKGAASTKGAPTTRRRGVGGGPDFSRARREFALKEGAAGFLRDSDKEHGLVNMTSSGQDFGISKLPELFLTTESYGLIWRLLKRGPVTVEIDMKNTISPGEVEVYNTVAELPGTDKAHEVVLIGGHLDSWDLGTGATDNGTGTMAVLEAARALKAAGVKPRRTIRFLMFTGEEQGLHGSKVYAKAHEKELDKLSAVLIHDMGTGRVTSIGLQGRYDLRETMDKVVAPFQRELGLEEISLRNMGGTDHLSFHPAGVPAFAVVQHEAEYRKTHHTESDTFDKVYADEVNQGAKVLAAWAYNVAMLPDILPRAPKRDTPSTRPAAAVTTAAKTETTPASKPADSKPAAVSSSAKK